MARQQAILRVATSGAVQDGQIAVRACGLLAGSHVGIIAIGIISIPGVIAPGAGG